MKKLIINNKEELYQKSQKDFYFYNKKQQFNLKYLFNIKIFMIVFFILNSFIDYYLIIENYQNKKKIEYLLELHNKTSENLLENKSNSKSNEIKILNLNNVSKDNLLLKDFPIIDRDMIGLKYPEIEFQELQKNLKNNEIISLFRKLLYQLEIKLLYLEKEINITKLVSFYTSRKIYLDNNHVDYNDGNPTEIHNIISWVVIHKSTQLKGIASDKYLACKYTYFKLGENLCEHKLNVYDNVEAIDFKKIFNFGNIVIKISNGCGDKIFVYKNDKINIELIKKQIQKNFEKDYGISNGEYFHLYSKKRIIIEKMFYPLTDLYEFKLYVVNHKIQLIYIRTLYKNLIRFTFFNPNFELLHIKENFNLDISKFNKEHLEKLKYYAIKLSEDFPNFIRVDLYLFHNKIYLSELTFDSNNGLPFLRNQEIIKKSGRDWKKVDY